MKTKPFSHVPGSETMTGPVITPGCWCQGRAEVRPGSQLTAQGPCLDKSDKWSSRAGLRQS